MSFDIFLQRFVNGEAVDADGDSMLAILKPLIAARSGGWPRIVTADGQADVYGIDDAASGLVINHLWGRALWDVVFELARAAEMAVMPVGCRTSVTDSGLNDELPAGSPRAARLTSGADTLATWKTRSRTPAPPNQYVPNLPGRLSRQSEQYRRSLDHSDQVVCLQRSTGKCRPVAVVA